MCEFHTICKQASTVPKGALLARGGADGCEFAVIKALSGDFKGGTYPAPRTIIPNVGIDGTAHAVMVGAHRGAVDLNNVCANAIDAHPRQLTVAAIKKAGLVYGATPPPT